MELGYLSLETGLLELQLRMSKLVDAAIWRIRSKADAGWSRVYGCYENCAPSSQYTWVQGSDETEKTRERRR